MILESIIIPDSSPSFLNLSLFICQLFAGGNFRMAHILYYPQSFDSHLYGVIHSNCPYQIPMIFIDITKPVNFHLDRAERTDHILQLIFLPQGQHWKESIYFYHIYELSTFYRVFVVATDQDLELIEKLNAVASVNSSTMILIHNVFNDTMRCYHMSKDLKGNIEIFKLTNTRTSSNKDLFDYVLGEKAYILYLGMAFERTWPCKNTDKLKNPLLKSQNFLDNFHYMQMNMVFINGTYVLCNASKFLVGRNLVQIVPTSSSKDYLFDLKPIDDKTQLSSFLC